MSEYWHLYCIDCASQHHIDNANHAGELLAQVVPYAKQIGALTGSPVSVRLDEHSLEPDWFRIHAEHQIVARSEYGSIMTSSEALTQATERYIEYLQNQIGRLRARLTG